MIAATSLVKLGVAGTLLLAAPVQARLSAPGHAPKINTHWAYTLTVSSGGKPAAGTVTAQIVDPIGGVHPVEFGSTTRKIVNSPFKGTFSDFIIWPKSSRGVPLQVRFTIRVGSAKKVISYPVTPRG